jgi:hypothetical protein
MTKSNETYDIVLADGHRTPPMGLYLSRGQ